MKATKLVGMLRLETAAQRQFLRLTPRERRIYARANADSRFALASEAGWFDHMSPAAKKKYMTEHPGSKFGPQGSIRTGVVTGVVNKDSARMGHVRQHNTDEHDAFGYTSATDQRHLGTFKTKDDAKRAINTHYKAGGHARAKVDPGDNAQVPFEEWQAQVHKHAIHGRPDPSELRRMYAAEHRVSPRAAAENFDDVNASKSFHDNRMYMDEDHD